MTAMVSYRVSSLNPLTHLFEVEMTVEQPHANQVVSLPVWIPGSYMVREFSKHLQGLSAHQGRRRCTLEQQNKNTWSVTCQSHKPLTLRYQVYALDASVRAAYLDGQRAFFNGTSLFLRAHGFSDQSHELNLKAPKGTQGWQVATALNPKSVDQRGWGTYVAQSYEELIDAPVECGRFWSGQFMVGPVKHRMIVTGSTAAFDGARMLADVQRICAAAIEMWHGKQGKPPHRHYVFLLHAVEDGYGGLEHGHSTALICSRRDLPRMGQTGLSDAYVTLLGLISHEYFHTWNVKRLRPREFETLNLEQENHTSLLWFFEGFTSYFDDWLLVKAGLIDAPHYLRLLGKTIASVQQTPGRKVQSVAQSSFDAWVKYYRQDENTPNATISYYTKGALVALCLDLSLRSEGSNLPSVMRGLWRRCAGGPMSEDDLLAELKKQTQRDWSAELQAWVHSTRELPLADLLRAHGVKIDTEADPISQRLGLRVQETPSGILIKSVWRDSAAEAAGMAAGDEWLGVQVAGSTTAAAWRLKKLDDLPLLMGKARRCKALISRDQTLHWLTLNWPSLGSTHWTLQPDPEHAPRLRRWL